VRGLARRSRDHDQFAGRSGVYAEHGYARAGWRTFARDPKAVLRCWRIPDFDYVINRNRRNRAGGLAISQQTGDQTVLVMNPDYGARLQLQKIVMLDVADIVVVNKTDLERAKAALSEIQQRLTQNKRKQEIVATVAKRHRDPGVDELFELITKENT